MATTRTVTDEYVLRPRVDDQASGPVDRLTAKFGEFEQQAEGAAKAADKLGERIRDSAGRISEATTQFDRAANRYDAVTKASNALIAAQRELQQVQDAGARAVEKGTATQEQLDATTAALAQKISRLAEALGTARANAEANSEAQARWNGQITGGQAAVGAFAQSVTASAQALKQSQIAFADWLNAGQSSDAAVRRFNVNLADYGDSLQRLRAQYDPLFAASKQYEAELANIQRAVNEASLSEANAAAARIKAAEAMAGEKLNLQAMRAEFDPLYAAQTRYSAALDRIALAEKEAGLGAAEAAQARNAAAAAYDAVVNPVEKLGKAHTNLAAAANNARFAQQQAGVQMVQFFSSIQGGAPILLAAVQQFHQMADVAIATGTGFGTLVEGAQKAANAIGNFVVAHPAAVAITVLAAAVALLSYNAETTAKAEAALQAELSATRADYIGMAEAIRASSRDIAASTTLTVEQGAAISKVFAAIPGVARDSFSSLGIMVANLSRALGTDITSAARLAATALLDPAKAALEMASADKPLIGMNASLLITIERLQAMGDRSTAASLASGVLGRTAALAAAQITPLTEAHIRLLTALREFGDGAPSIWQRTGEAINRIFANIETAIASAIDKIKGLRGYLLEFNDYLKTTRWGQAMEANGQQTAGTQAAENVVAGSGVAMSPTQQQKFWGTFVGAQDTATSSKNAMGTMQLLQSTANSMGINPLIKSDNIFGGMQYIKELSGKLDNRWDTSRAYYAGPTGMNNPAKLDETRDYATKVFAADISKLPSDTVSLIEYWGRVLKMTPEQIDLGKRIAMVENEGSQGPIGKKSFISVNPATQETVAQGAQARADAAAIRGATNLPNVLTTQKQIDDLTGSLRDLEETRKRILDIQNRTPDEEENLRRVNAAIAQQTVDRQNLLNPMDAQTKAMQDQTQATSIYNEADARLAAINAEIARQRAENPAFPISDADAAKTVAAAMDLQAAGATKLAQELVLTTGQQREMGNAWDKGSAAANEASLKQQAYNIAIKYYNTDNAPAFKRHLSEIAALLRGVTAATGLDTIKEQAAQTREGADATMRIAAAWDGSAASLDHLTNLERANADALRAKLIPGRKDYTEAVEAETRALDAASAANKVMAQETASVSAVSSAASQAFNTVGNAITQSFVQGQGAAVNWGNVMRAVISQVIQKILELAVLNPILNDLFGQNNGTLGTAITVLSRGGSELAGGGGGGGFGGISNLFSLGSTANSVSGALGGQTIQGALGFGAAAIPSGFAPVGGGSTLLFNPTTGMYAAGPSTGVVLPTIGGASLGAWAGGIGAGFAAGSLAGGLIQSSMGKTGPAPMIGAGVGAVGGAVIGTMIAPGIGTIIGGLAGGLLGGGGGGFIGPRRASPFSSTYLGIDQNGLLNLGVSANQMTSSNRISTQQDITTLNNFLSAQGVQVRSTGMLHQVGTGGRLNFANPGGYWDSGKFNDLASGFSQLRFGSNSDSILASKLGDKPFGNFTDFQNYIVGFKTAQTAVVNMLAAVNAAMASLDKTTGSYNETVTAITANYDQNKTAADALLASGFLSDDQVKQLTKAEADLVTMRDRGLAAAREAAEGVLNTAASGYQSRYLAAFSTANGGIANARTSSLYNFDAQATAERKAYSAQIVAIYGDGIKATAGYAWRMGQLENALGEERLAIVQDYAQKMIDAQASVTSYDRSLTGRYLTAQASISGSSSDSFAAQLYNFDTQAQSERDAYTKQLVGYYSESYKTTADYAAQMALLEKTLGMERLAIQTEYNNKISQTATASVTSLSNYVSKLMTGNQAPLSPTAQYDLASNQFNAVLGAAKAGDWTSYQSITSYADALLSASGAMFGTGAQYVADFNRLLDGLNSLASMSPDSLTAAIYRSETRSQTQQLVDSLALVRTEIASLRQEIAQGSSAPLRLSA